MPKQFLPLLLDFRHSQFARLLVALVIHLDVVLRVAFAPVLGEEFAVAAIEDVHFRIGEAGVVGGIDVAVVVAYEFGCERGTVDRIFAVEDEKGRR